MIFTNKIMDESQLPVTAPSTQANNKKFWKQLQDFGVAGLSAATGDPEAMKTIVEVLANSIHFGLERVDLKDENKEEVKQKVEEAIDSGADGLVKVLTLYQEKAADANTNLRKRYGRKYRKTQSSTATSSLQDKKPEIDDVKQDEQNSMPLL